MLYICIEFNLYRMTLEEFYFKHVKIILPNGETVSPPDRDIDRELLKYMEKASKMKRPLLVHNSGQSRINPELL